MVIVNSIFRKSQVSTQSSSMNHAHPILVGVTTRIPESNVASVAGDQSESDFTPTLEHP